MSVTTIVEPFMFEVGDVVHSWGVIRGGERVTFPWVDGVPAGDGPIPGQITVYDALADASLPAQEDRCRDERTKTHTN